MPTQLKLRVSLAGVLRSAAETIEKLAARIREEAEWKEDGEEYCPCWPLQPDSDSMMLRATIRHIEETIAGRHSVEQFAEFYCLTEPAAEG